MSWTELLMWMEYDRIDPLGEERGDLRNGMLMALIHNQQVDRTKHPEHIRRAVDFMPFTEKPKFENNLDKQIYDAFMSLGAKINKRN